ncbi:MAG: hypothetical protein H6492_00425 [Candidatus Paracaedibacteraceae bacterium]|nr:hypothetical protein [Candidatus Paracaedibacteraceae bacterium]
MKQRRFDIPFGSDVWISIVLGLMLFVTSISLIVSVGVNQYIQDWNTSAQATFTIELPHKSDILMPEVMQVLKQYPEVESVSVLDKSYVQKLMFQLGVASIDAPILIDFIVSKDVLLNFDSDKILNALQKIIPQTSIIKPVLTSQEALSMAQVVGYIAFGFGVIMVVAMCAIIAFLMYSEVQTHERTIDLFNLLGAPNYFISKIFQNYVFLILVKAFLLSLALNVCLYYASYIVYMGDTYLARGITWITWAYIVLGIPVLMVSVIQLIVPVTVLSCLKNKYNNSLHA